MSKYLGSIPRIRIASAFKVSGPGKVHAIMGGFHLIPMHYISRCSPALSPPSVT